MKIKIDPRDAVFSKLVRTRDRWRCRHCKTQYQEGDRGLQAAHIIGRRNKAVRWAPINCLALCYSCHMHFTANPIEFTEWVGKIVDLDALRERARPIMKLSKADLAEILINLKHEWKAMVPGKQFASPYRCDRAEPSELERRARAAREAA